MQAKLTTVSEIHAYPLRPKGYAEPLFHDRESRKEILDHFARGGWLRRGSELAEVGEAKESQKTPRFVPEPLEAGTVREILVSWREVDRWWEPDGGVDTVWRLVEDHEGRQKVQAEPAPGQSSQSAA